MPQLSTIIAEQPQPPQQQDAKHPFCSRTTKPLYCLPSFPSFPSHHTKPLTCSFSQQCPPHTEQPRHPNFFDQQPNCASKTKSLQETFHWASPEQRINFGRAAASPSKFRMTTPGCLPVCKAFRAASQALYIHNVHTRLLAGCLLSTDPT